MFCRRKKLPLLSFNYSNIVYGAAEDFSPHYAAKVIHAGFISLLLWLQLSTTKKGLIVSERDKIIVAHP